MARRSLLPLFFLFLAVPTAAHAAVSISEIMYDPIGSDAKHEWLEVYNDGMSADLSKWKLFEGDVNHKLVLVSGNAVLDTGGYAILADDPVTFKKDFPQYGGALFNISLSGGLNNADGESLILKDATGKDAFTVSYAPALGADGDGNSLQYVSGNWQPLTPTPGASGNGAVKIAPAEKVLATTSHVQAVASGSQPTLKPQSKKDTVKSTEAAAPVTAETSDPFTAPSVTWFLGFAVLVLLGILGAQFFRNQHPK